MHLTHPYRWHLALICSACMLAGCHGGTESITQSSSAASERIAITGTPPTTVSVDSIYQFQPTTTGGGASVGYSVQNKPAWAQFDTATGRLMGTPDIAGVYPNIVISATTASASASLPAFSVTVSPSTVEGSSSGPGTAALTWLAPATNTDGTPVNDLAGFHIYYGAASTFTSLVDDETGDISTGTYTVTGLAPGTYVFQVCAYNALGVESAPSNQVTVTVS